MMPSQPERSVLSFALETSQADRNQGRKGVRVDRYKDTDSGWYREKGEEVSREAKMEISGWPSVNADISEE